MTSLLPLQAVAGAVRAAPPASPRPAVSPPGADGSFAAALGAVRDAHTPSIGEQFETQTLASFLGALLPADGSSMWGGKAGAMWRGLYAEKLAGALAAHGGIGIAPLIDRKFPQSEDRK